MSSTQYEVVVGLEIHAQISTKSKMFCSCSNDSFGVQPNTNVCPVCMGFPGMLPVFNEAALEKGVVAALALHCDIPEFSKFDRKNYFYPDLPKGFQISQYDQAVSKGGYVDISLKSGEKRIRVHRLHLEDDAGKLVHVQGGTLCDYNRSGSPLMEIVSEADMRSVEEASAYAQEVRRILRSVYASDCDMEKGMMRFDANVSLRPVGREQFGTKAEVKNLNSFRSLESALFYEIERQKELLDRGESVVQETRGWDDAKGETVSQRSKEAAHDYRYFPEPDLPPVIMKADRVEELKKLLPELPRDRRNRFIEQYELSEEDAGILTENRSMADYFETAVRVSKDSKRAVSFINTILLKHLNAEGKSLSDCLISAEQLGRLIQMIKEGAISNNMAKTEVFEDMYVSGKSPDEVVNAKGLAMVSDTGELENACKEVLKANAGPAADYKSGKQNAFGFLVGAVMKKTKGQAHPGLVNEILKKLLA